ncbi:MAG: hypothetical protein JNK85_00680 [Verrucomicrobiales bacterium]|nr:hypothetical protein [Verrucomicrobiales bacterium]
MNADPITVRVREVAFHVLPMRTRMPFKYGIASLSALPHLLVRTEVEVGARRVVGITAEGLPPKWFTKDPATTFEQDLVGMLDVIRHAAAVAVELGRQPSVFAFWWALHQEQSRWAAERGHPPLLSGLGTSLMEGAVIDGFCQATASTFHEVARNGVLGLRLDAVHAELSGTDPAALLPSSPVPQVRVRHTIGLVDPLFNQEISPAERLHDGLPQSLEEGIRRYGLRCFKLKLRGHLEADLERLRGFAAALEQAGVASPLWTLDGNEQFPTVAAFREVWERASEDSRLRPLLGCLAAVEQPLHRTLALTGETGDALRRWEGRPPWIIDESDGEPESLERALALGYAGISHKNCKGVIRGLANACVLRRRTVERPDLPFLLTSEDLANVGPVAMLQDLCVAASLGLTHSERNGHHYFRGLSAFPTAVQEEVLAVHGDLYERAPAGFATLRIRHGALSTASMMAAPFGCGIRLDATEFQPLEAWAAKSLIAGHGHDRPF